MGTFEIIISIGLVLLTCLGACAVDAAEDRELRVLFIGDSTVGRMDPKWQQSGEVRAIMDSKKWEITRVWLDGMTTIQAMYEKNNMLRREFARYDRVYILAGAHDYLMGRTDDEIERDADEVYAVWSRCAPQGAKFKFFNTAEIRNWRDHPELLVDDWHLSEEGYVKLFSLLNIYW